METNRPEQTLATLLETAFRIKEDVVKNLQDTHGTVLLEASARKLLESHIHIITHIVKQLSKDIQVLEAQIVQRDGITTGTTFAVQSLDHKNLTVIGDLRGRVARCDATIATLSGDVRVRGQEIRKLQQEVTKMHSEIELRLKELEHKISESMGRFEMLQTEQIASYKNVTGDIQKNIQQLQIRTSNGLKELEEEACRIRRWTEKQLSNTTQIQTEYRQQLQTLLHERMEEVEKKLKAQELLLIDHLGRMEKQLEKKHSVDQTKQIESRINTKMNAMKKSLQTELEQIRRTYHSGFQSVHDAIASLTLIGDTKAKLDKEELKKDIRQIRRMIVGQPDD